MNAPPDSSVLPIAAKQGAAPLQVARLECWLVTARTAPGSEEQRRIAAPAYTAYLQQHLDRIALGAQVHDGTGPGAAVHTRLYFVISGSAHEARRLLEDSPYCQAGVYEVSDVNPATGMLGSLMGGVTWVPRQHPTAPCARNQ